MCEFLAAGFTCYCLLLISLSLESASSQALLSTTCQAGWLVWDVPWPPTLPTRPPCCVFFFAAFLSSPVPKRSSNIPSLVPQFLQNSPRTSVSIDSVHTARSSSSSSSPSSCGPQLSTKVRFRGRSLVNLLSAAAALPRLMRNQFLPRYHMSRRQAKQPRKKGLG